MASAAGSVSRPPEVVKVRRDVLAACMTCPLCKKLLKDATTIYECLHTFCRKCILEKITDEEVECCPICNIDLGCVPVEKLRPDHNLQDVRAKIFPFKRRKINAPEVAPSITLPIRRKERSLSSLVVYSPRVSSNSTGRRTKGMTRRASSLRRPSTMIDEAFKKEENGTKERIENLSSHGTAPKITQTKRQNSSNAESSTRTHNKESENGEESIADKSELWKSLNCLVEIANRTRDLKSGPSSPSIKAEQSNAHDSDNDNMNKSSSKIANDITNNGSSLVPPVIRRRRRRRRDIGTPTTQALVDVAHATRDKRMGPIWLSIVPSFDQQRQDAATQYPACFLRLKDGSLPVSFIQKYLVKKLNLSSEAEVDIECGEQKVDPMLPLHSLVDIWLQPRPNLKIQTSVGASAKDFIMVLNYKCKPQAP